MYIIEIINIKEDIKSDAEAIALIYQKIPKEEINDNKSVERDINGNATIYDDKGNLEKHINLKGETI